MLRFIIHRDYLLDIKNTRWWDHAKISTKKLLNVVNMLYCHFSQGQTVWIGKRTQNDYAFRIAENQFHLQQEVKSAKIAPLAKKDSESFVWFYEGQTKIDLCEVTALIAQVNQTMCREELEKLDSFVIFKLFAQYSLGVQCKQKILAFFSIIAQGYQILKAQKNRNNQINKQSDLNLQQGNIYPRILQNRDCGQLENANLQNIITEIPNHRLRNSQFQQADNQAFIEGQNKTLEQISIQTHQLLESKAKE